MRLIFLQKFVVPILTSGGPASFIMPLQIGKTPIVVPRQHQFNEHVNDHQVEFARNVAQRMGTIIPVEDINTLGDIITNYDQIVAGMGHGMSSNNAKFNELVAGYAKDAGYPISTFVRKQALSEKVTVNYNIVADIGEIQKLTAQAAGIGNNLNQIARYLHGGGLASRGMLEELKKCIAEIRELRQEIVQLGGAYRGNSKTHRK